MSQMKNLLVFVYGTLKREQPNHHWLATVENGHSKFYGEGITVDKYPLVVATKYNIPFLLNEPGMGNNVVGDVFEVDEKMLSRLDVLEEHPYFYERMLKPIRIDESAGVVLDCWAYFLKDHRRELLTYPMLVRYDPKAGHGQPYAVKNTRDPNYDYKSPVMN